MCCRASRRIRKHERRTARDDVTPDTHLDPPLPGERPWRRFWARSFDSWCATLLMIPLAGAIPLEVLEDEGVLLLLRVSVYLLWVPVEGLLLAWVGFTPGKYLFRIEVRRQGAKPGFATALLRSALVMLIGLACGFPGLQSVAMLIGYTKIYAGEAYWDQKSGTEVVCRELGAARSFVAAFVALTAFGGIARELQLIVEALWPWLQSTVV